MFREVNLSQLYLHDHGLRKDAKKQFQLVKKHVERIKKSALKKIAYPEFQESYDYVDGLFPGANVKEVVIYKVGAQAMAKMGYAGVEGFYDPTSKIVVLSSTRRRTTPINRRYHIEAKVSRDEVIVHELCHYCYVALENRSISSEMREEFAYGWSIGYLRRKGYSDEYIVKYNFLPYLMNIAYEEATRNILARNNISTREFNSYSRFKKKEFNRKYGRKIFDRSKELAMERGHRLIDMYSKKLEEGTDYTGEEDNADRFDFLDL